MLNNEQEASTGEVTRRHIMIAQTPIDIDTINDEDYEDGEESSER